MSPETEKKPPKEAAVAGGDKKKKRAKRKAPTYKICILMVLKQVHRDWEIPSKAMNIMNGFLNYIFEKLAQESSRLARYDKKSTITSCEIHTAIRLFYWGN